MAFAADPVHITGLVELQRALKQIDGEAQKQLKVVLDSVARTVAMGASRRVPTKTGAASKSLRAQSSQREARVVAGSNKVPYYGWLDFGGRVGKGGSVSRPVLKRGRYMYPAYDANKTSIQRALEAQLTELVRSAGLEVTSG